MNAKPSPYPILVVALFLFAAAILPAAATLATDWLWFASEGYSTTFWELILAKAGAGAVVGGTAFGFFAANAVWAFTRVGARSGALRSRPFVASLAGCLALAAGFALAGAAAWTEWTMFRFARDFDWKEPLFGKDAGFYVFRLPMLERAQAFATAAVVLAAFGVCGIYAWLGAFAAPLTRVGDRVVFHGVHVAGPARKHLGWLAMLLGLAIAAGQWLARYGEVSAPGGLLAGASFADVYARIPLLTAGAGIAAIGAGLAFDGIVRTKARPVVAAAAAFAAVRILLLVYPHIVQRFVVLPSELEKERTFLERHIEATRRAWGVDAVEERALSGDAKLDRAAVDADRDTIENVRLWDHGELLETFGQVQEIRTYYEFGSVDNDRYEIDGRLRQIMLSPRELEVSNLPNRTWINERTVYTHGYGVALGPVNRVTPEGLPELYVKDIPPKTDKPELGIERPEIYFGERSSGYAIVRTETKEFSHPSGEENVYRSYEGEGGVAIGGFFRRVMFGLRFGDVKIPLAGGMKTDSRILLRRQPLDRIHALAPFLILDGDPYLVVHEGRLVWIADAYTATDRFPYSHAIRGVNAMRNSVKATVDAYDGTVRFYLADPTDPIARAWSAAFPDLILPLSDMPAGLRAHLRYPAALFERQASVFAAYHMRDPGTFYNREDLWQTPAIGRAPMDPYYTVMRLPGEEAPEFVLMLPLTPASKDNLAAWMAARSDGENYGKLIVYRFPREKLVYGPAQISARIDQNEEISPQITLWNQQGSETVRGTLLVIPIRDSLLYVQPLYMRASSGRIPELKRVILGYEDRIVMEPTLDRALERIFGEGAGPGDAAPPGEEIGAGGAAESGGTGDAGGAPEPALGASEVASRLRELALEAKAAFDEAQAAVAAGDWATFGEKWNAVGAAVERLGTIAGPEPLIEDSFLERAGPAFDDEPLAPPPSAPALGLRPTTGTAERAGGP